MKKNKIMRNKSHLRKIRALIGYLFRIFNRSFVPVKTRYRGLEKYRTASFNRVRKCLMT